MKTCRFCEHCYIDMNNNYRCDIKDYTESNILRRNWGQWEVDAEKCNNYKTNHESKEKNSNNEWQDIVYVQLKDSDILYKQEYLEFDTLSTELKANEQITDETHWRDVRERAAIAAMQGMLSNPAKYLAEGDTYPKVAVRYADALIEELKKK